MRATYVVWIALLATTLLQKSVYGETVQVGGEANGWKITGDFPDLDLVVGDVLTFEYAGGHTVVEVKDKKCNFAGKTNLAGTSDSPYSHTLTEAGTFHFACDIPGHCPAGMLFSVTVKEGKKKAKRADKGSKGKGKVKGGKKKMGRKQKKPKKPRKPKRQGKGKGGDKKGGVKAKIKTSGAAGAKAKASSGKEIVVGGEAGWVIAEYEDIVANVGDTLVFTYSQPHTVVQTKERGCDFKGKVVLAGVDDSPFRMKLTKGMVGKEMFIACDIQGHCPSGMTFSVTVEK